MADNTIGAHGINHLNNNTPLLGHNQYMHGINKITMSNLYNNNITRIITLIQSLHRASIIANVNRSIRLKSHPIIQ